MSGSNTPEGVEKRTEVPEDLPALFSYLQERAEKIESYSDRLREAWKKAEDVITRIAQKAGIESDVLNLLGADNEWGNQTSMQLKKSHDSYWYLFWNYDKGRTPPYLSREALVLATKAFPQFMREYAAKLAEEQPKFLWVAEVAESMALALQSIDFKAHREDAPLDQVQFGHPRILKENGRHEMS